jgi:DeoR/GlpR family transcriptional regulator of sugar metabolism
MLARERQAYILERIRNSGAVRVADLTRALEVSDMTIRRDLDQLAQLGLLDKVHGGATAPDLHSTDEPGFEMKSVRDRPEKEAIARAAAEMVRPGSAVGLSAGTTTWTLAHALLDIPSLTVVTNSVRIAGVFYESSRPDRTVVLTGGVRTPSDALVGPVAEATLRSLNLDTVFLGVHGMDEQVGFTSPNLQEAETDRAFVRAGRRLVVLADHSKWGVIGLSTIADLSEADVLVTDDGLTPEASRVLAEIVPQVLRVPARPSATAAPSAAAGPEAS